MQISERGQVTIPKEYRAQFGFLPNTEVEFVVRNNELVLVRKATTQSQAIRALRGRKQTGMTTDELMSLLRDGN
ncbi:AbrB/MazE/SpoVT family DNA-binding domain-containing protein [uncultured Thiothrix sp.]|uniref:AbrB/MazE/SpoVT family DNA-binding domain-containing protein n=1 Tax=uncultured Thiothrix sp. TaxID=223185 RepID=UPI00261BCCD0|nr:AbrB/MazE/SpoVT family DNA-binding domain-containing protein [uncultured Thiothrix sp.]